MSGGSESSIEEEEEEEESIPTRPELTSRARTESFDKMVSDELKVALAMMGMNSLNSLDEKQKERVEKLRSRIKAGESAEDDTPDAQSSQKTKNEKDTDSTALNEILSDKTSSNAFQDSSNHVPPHLDTAPGSSAKKSCNTAKEPEERTCKPSFENKTDQHQDTASKVDAICTQNSAVSRANDVANIGVEAEHKASEEAERKACEEPEPEQGESDKLADLNQLGECLEDLTSAEENKKQDDLSVSSDVQKISLLESPAVSTESKPSLTGCSSEHAASTRSNTPESVSSMDRASENTLTVKSEEEMDRKAAKTEQTKQSHGKGSKPSKTRQLRKKRGQWIKGVTKYNSLPPLNSQPATPQQNSGSKQYSYPAGGTRQRLLPKQATANQFSQHQLSPRKFVLKPHFTSVAESTPRTGGFPSQYWVVEGNGTRYPQAASRNMERISWKAVLEDVGNIDGYRKIHAEKLKRQSEHRTASSAGSSSQEEVGYLKRYLKKSSALKNNSYSKIHGSANRRLKQRPLPPLPNNWHYPTEANMKPSWEEERKSGPDDNYPLMHTRAYNQTSTLPSLSDWKQSLPSSTKEKNRHDPFQYAAVDWSKKR